MTDVPQPLKKPRAPTSLRLFQAALWLSVLGIIGYYSFRDEIISALTAPSAPAPSRVGALTPGVPLNAPFKLVNEDGVAVTEADFAGKPGAWFYGFTNCPDICPTALSEMATLLGQLGPEAERLNAVFVTVDPERDTLAVMKDYVNYFDERIIGLTGDLAAVTEMARSRYVKFEKVAQTDGSYTMQHSASIFLVDAAGGFAGTLDPEEAPDVKLAKLRKLIADAKA